MYHSFYKQCYMCMYVKRNDHLGRVKSDKSKTVNKALTGFTIKRSQVGINFTGGSESDSIKDVRWHNR